MLAAGVGGRVLAAGVGRVVLRVLAAGVGAVVGPVLAADMCVVGVWGWRVLGAEGLGAMVVRSCRDHDVQGSGAVDAFHSVEFYVARC